MPGEAEEQKCLRRPLRKGCHGQDQESGFKRDLETNILEQVYKCILKWFKRWEGWINIHQKQCIGGRVLEQGKPKMRWNEVIKDIAEQKGSEK